MFVEKPKEEVYDVIINQVGSCEVVVDVLASKCEINSCERNQNGRPFILQRVLVLVSMDVDSLCACKILQVRECSFHPKKQSKTIKLTRSNLLHLS